MLCAYLGCEAQAELPVLMLTSERLYEPVFCQHHGSDRDAVESCRILIALVESWEAPRTSS